MLLSHLSSSVEFRYFLQRHPGDHQRVQHEAFAVGIRYHLTRLPLITLHAAGLRFRLQRSHGNLFGGHFLRWHNFEQGEYFEENDEIEQLIFCSLAKNAVLFLVLLM